MPLYWGTPTSIAPSWITSPTTGTATTTACSLGAGGGIGAVYQSQTTTTTTNTWVWAGDNEVDADTYYYLATQRAVVYRERTAEERAVLQEQRRQATIRAEQREMECRQALARARDLLLEHLTPAQRETYTKNHWFTVQGGKTKIDYRINSNSYAGNVWVMKDGKPIESICCHCDHIIPLPDQHLAQKLALEYDEERFLRTANRRRIA